MRTGTCTSPNPTEPDQIALAMRPSVPPPPRATNVEEMAEATEVLIDGHVLRLTNLDKILYPAAGFTKAQVIDYYRQVAPVMLTHIADRCPTLVRAPDGVAGEVFFEKRCPAHHPQWIATGPANGVEQACVIDSLAALVWTANLAAIELHVQQTPRRSLLTPSAMVFDLDPGDGATILDCRRVALQLQEWLQQLNLVAFVKTSGSKGLHLSVPIHDATVTHDDVKRFALSMGQLLERRDDAVTTNMAKDQRMNKVFIDWSQNDRHKTTVAPYSLRIREHPTVSTPISWDELNDAATADDLRFLATTVLERVTQFGDVWAAAITADQQLPRLA